MESLTSQFVNQTTKIDLSGSTQGPQMLESVQLSPLCNEKKFTVTQNVSFSITDPRKEELAHRVRSPPDAPTTGTKSKQSKCRGEKFPMKAISK
jgi:hypothetical protein